MKVLINYANHRFKCSQKLNTKTGLKYGGFDKVITYSHEDIEKDFYEQNKKILGQRRGNGYWLWKPYFIKKTLEQLNPGDFLFYCDAGAYFINPIDPLIEISLEHNLDILSFEHFERFEYEWTKRDAFILMDCDTPDYTESRQRLSSFSLWRKSVFTMDFLNEFLKFAKDERILTDIDNKCGYPNYKNFKENRHDQSIFSLLTKKYNLQSFRDPSQMGNKYKKNYPISKYGQLIVSTRRRGRFYVLPIGKRNIFLTKIF